eukprot:TRINITY_DN60656_c0_g1_i1.p1 TRINITY_DN60656_c0_g1~~TRINITY_DN60656_c0_g1_i1.p1  ORF type:complete len:845 (+),score=256.90 TRINITY_DN60656_c0_g1_i1:173-2536(+)
MRGEAEDDGWETAEEFEEEESPSGSPVAGSAAGSPVHGAEAGMDGGPVPVDLPDGTRVWFQLAEKGDSFQLQADGVAVRQLRFEPGAMHVNLGGHRAMETVPILDGHGMAIASQVRALAEVAGVTTSGTIASAGGPTAAPLAAGGAREGGEEWACRRCTLLNDALNLRCLACGAERPSAAQKRPRHVDAAALPPEPASACRHLQRFARGLLERRACGARWLRGAVPELAAGLRRWEQGHPLRLLDGHAHPPAAVAAVLRLIVRRCAGGLLRVADRNRRIPQCARCLELEGLLVRLRECHTAAEGGLAPQIADRDWCPPGWWPSEHFDLRRYLRTTPKRLREGSGPVFATGRLLEALPWSVPLHARVMLFHDWREDAQVDRPAVGPKLQRKKLVTDGLCWLAELPRKQLRYELVPRFVKEIGAGDGVLRDFLASLTGECFRPYREGAQTLFTENSRHQLVPAGHIHAAAGYPVQQVRSGLRASGRALGVALLRGVPVRVPLAHFVLRGLIGRLHALRDLESYDPEFFRGLVALLRLPPADIDALGLEFEAQDANPFAYDPDSAEEDEESWETECETDAGEEDGESGGEEDLSGGPSWEPPPTGPPFPVGTAVTSANIHEYVAWESVRRMRGSIQDQVRLMRLGLQDVIPVGVIRMFDADEWAGMLSPGQIDVDDWESNTEYERPLKAGHPLVVMFWRVVRELTDDDRRRLLHFATGSEAPPHQGFHGLTPPFTITGGAEGDDEDEGPERLPTAATCFHQLELPMYRTEEELRMKLVTAIRNAKGFGLV